MHSLGIKSSLARTLKNVDFFRTIAARSVSAPSSYSTQAREDQRKHVRIHDRAVENDQTLKNEDIEPSLRAHPYRRFIKLWGSKEELAEHLLKNIVHNSDGVIAFNKPFGVGTVNVDEIKQYQIELKERRGESVRHDPRKVQEPPPPAINSLYHARGVTLSPYTLTDVLPILRSKLGLPSLVLGKTTEKFSSGAAVFCENEKLSERLLYLYKGAKASRVKHSSYLVVSTLTPELEHDVLNETVGVCNQWQEFKGRRLSVPIIERRFSNQRLKHHDVVPVQAEVQIVSRNLGLNSALVEIQTTVTKHHFLRIYANDLLMPILGDHLFSNRIQSMVGMPVVVNPLSVEPGTSTQVLAPDLLRRLQLNSAGDAIIVPLHAHLFRYTVPHFYGKWKHLVITAPPPDYFLWTCSQLKLDLDKALNVLCSSNSDTTVRPGKVKKGKGTKVKEQVSSCDNAEISFTFTSSQ